jgi:hypothetical protein
VDFPCPSRATRSFSNRQHRAVIVDDTTRDMVRRIDPAVAQIDVMATGDDCAGAALLQLFAATASASQRESYAALLTGATYCMVDLKRKGLREAVRAIKRERITLLRAPPYLFRRMRATPR